MKLPSAASPLPIRADSRHSRAIFPPRPVRGGTMVTVGGVRAADGTHGTVRHPDGNRVAVEPTVTLLHRVAPLRGASAHAAFPWVALAPARSTHGYHCPTAPPSGRWASTDACSAKPIFSLTPARVRWAREGVRPPRVGGNTAGLRSSSANPLSQRERVRVRENGHFRRRAPDTRRTFFPRCCRHSGPEGQRTLAGGKAAGHRPRNPAPDAVASRRDAGAATSTASRTPARVPLSLPPLPGATALLRSPYPRLSSALPPGATPPLRRHA